MMTDLIETDVFPPGIYQYEETDPALGGVPNEVTKAGLLNIPNQQLANRTLHLLNRLTGIGDNAIDVADINAIDKSGFYTCDGAATGHPAPGGGRGELIHVQSDDARNQIFFLTIGTVYARHRTSGGGWQAWERVWLDGYAQDEIDTILQTGAYLQQEDYGLKVDDVDTAIDTGIYFGRSADSPVPAAGDNPFPASSRHFILQVMKAATGDPNAFLTQLATEMTPTGPQMKVRGRTTDDDMGSTDWTDWDQVWHGQHGVSEATALVLSLFANRSLTNTGYQFFPGGLCVQWGIAVEGDNPLPTTFPNACFVSFGSDNDDSIVQAVATSCNQTTITVATPDTGTVFYFAIGH